MVKTVAEKTEKKQPAKAAEKTVKTAEAPKTKAVAAKVAAPKTVEAKTVATPKTGKYHAAVGRRKTSTAVVKLFKGTGQFSVRKDDDFVSLQQYFGGALYMYENALYPFTVLGNDTSKKFDVEIVVSGGGMAGQAEAIRLAFARALIEFNQELRVQLKPYGLLKRDPRRKERKKPGLLKARKSGKWSKR